MCSNAGVGWSRTGEGEAGSRLGDKTSAGEKNSIKNMAFVLLFYPLQTLSHLFLPPTDTVVSKVVIPRLQPTEQSSHMSPNKSSKVSWNQQAPHEITSFVRATVCVPSPTPQR